MTRVSATGMPVLFTGLAAVAAVNTVTSYDGWAHTVRTLTIAATVIGVTTALAMVSYLFARTPVTSGARTTGGRSVTVRGHAHTGHRASPHEAGHVAGARGVGGRVVSARVYRNGTGFVRAVVPDARGAIVFLYAGQAAHGNPDGASADDAEIRRTLREFPRGELRLSVHRETSGTPDRVARRPADRAGQEHPRPERKTGRMVI